MTASTPKRALQTRIVQPDDVIPEGFRSFVPPVARASTVVFPDLATMRALVWHNDNQWRYGLHATPTSLAPRSGWPRSRAARMRCCSRRASRRS